MASSSEQGFHVFREGRRRAVLGRLLYELRAAVGELGPAGPADKLYAALLCAGELECALHDANHEHAKVVDGVTDLLADLAVAHDRGCDSSILHQQLSKVPPLLETLENSARQHPETVTISTAEGFAYYALHPLDYADLVWRCKIAFRSAHVVCIRSIGVTLGAVAAAGLRARGVSVSRTTVRPHGHPYDRRSEFDEGQRRSIAAALDDGAKFLVCDEGPGRSGSSFLSVAEALERAGVPRERILLLCSCGPDVGALCAPNAADRWSRYEVLATGMTNRLPHDADAYLGGGAWREYFLPPPVVRRWPGAWTQMERLKYLSADGESMLKFEGHGHYGESVRKRIQALVGAGFSPQYLGREEGFGRTTIVGGCVGEKGKLSRTLLKRLAEYCAWRSGEFAVSCADTAPLEKMVRLNLRTCVRGDGFQLRLPVERAVIADGRMQPQKWLCTAGGHWLKLDGAIHGDDHFYPGPCDIAWDLAGVCVEWELSGEGRELLISDYARATGDRVQHRLPNYEFAYAVFRMAWSSMAAASMRGTADAELLQADAGRYRRSSEKHIGNALQHRYLHLVG